MASKAVSVEVKTQPQAKPRPRSQSRGRNKNVKITVNSKPTTAPNRRRRRNRRPMSQHVNQLVKRQLARSGATGPKPSISQKATATLGTVGANTSGNAELEMCMLSNPILVKDNTGSTAFGPIQALGAQYSLWRIKTMHIKLTPLVGSSAVSGTVVRMSLNSTATPSSTSWSGLGARKHLDVVVGRSATFRLNMRDLGGPMEGWWKTNTNDSGLTTGPAIEIHTLGKTKSTYQNADFTGGLFLCEVMAVWEFANYSSNPSLASLLKGTTPPETISFSGSAGEPLIMEAETTTQIAMAIASASQLGVTATNGGEPVADTIFQIVNTGVEGVAAVVPPPFNWLVQGGWWFVKKMVGRTNSTKARHVVYASYEDALSNKPAICTGQLPSNANTSLTGKLNYTQMNAPSTGFNESAAPVQRFIPFRPGEDIILTANLQLGNFAVSVLRGTKLFVHAGMQEKKFRAMALFELSNILVETTTSDEITLADLDANPMELFTVYDKNWTDQVGKVLAFTQYFNEVVDGSVRYPTLVTAFLVKATHEVSNVYDDGLAFRSEKRKQDNYITFNNDSGNLNFTFSPGKYYILVDLSFNIGTQRPNSSTVLVGHQVWQVNTTGRFSNSQLISPMVTLPPPNLQYIFKFSTSEDWQLVPLDVGVSSRDSSAYYTEPEPEMIFDDEYFDPDLPDDKVYEMRQKLINLCLSEGMSYASASSTANIAFQTAADRVEDDIFHLRLVDGFSPDEARADAIRAREDYERRGHAE